MKNFPSVQKCYWADVRKEITKLNSDFARIIDDIDPGKKFRLYRIKYRYGSEIVRKGVFHIPNDQGKLIPITEPSIPNQIQTDLNYNLLSNPVSMLLKNSSELFINLEKHSIPSYGLARPGNVLSTGIILNKTHSLQPAFIWNMTAGARSIFMLPKISNTKNHKNLQKTFHINIGAPESMFQHWHVFRELVNSKNINCNWETEILYFSKPWINLFTSDNYITLEHYLLKQQFKGSEYWRHQYIWNMVFSKLQNEYNIKDEPYIIETVHHILFMGLGVLAGFKVAKDELYAPIKQIQTAYTDVYKLRPYPPIIMQPHCLSQDTPDSIYYSLNYPNTLEFPPRTSHRRSSISDLYSISNLLNKYIKRLSDNSFNTRGSVFDLALDKRQYSFYHDLHKDYSNINSTENIPLEDSTFMKDNNTKQNFPILASFVRGCIKVQNL